ncbi:ammonium transporter [Algimonas ampicilliniresistens]|uniref:Ammonium transporter n=1 Tax=Algimonas ampicilliniresistens TaxID=1298735 RepID=A0ABQ5VBG5_9PROT|nr:ammonium transporter [Algimonas ampicilliniresistens]GLQ24158.1 ammonium transporter [Algimonas ampicilliniresistens]
MRRLGFTLGLGAAVAALPAVAMAQDVTTVIEAANSTAFIFNTLLFLIGGFLVMWMAAGFAMLEAGFVRTKNVSMQCLKNIALYSVAGLMFWAMGYNFLYSGGSEFIGIGAFGPYGMDPVGLDAGSVEASAQLASDLVGTGYSTASDWFFQMVFCATTASIVSGTIAERVKFWPFILFVVVLTGFIYPVVASWEWGTGFLDDMGFSDFAGSTLVHSTGGWAALVGAIIIGPRLGKYVGGKVHPIPASNIPLATLGMFILWLGWFGFNGASQLAAGTIADVADVSRIFVNTNMAAAGGVIAAIIYTQLRYKKIDVTLAINGALAGLVAITAEPLAPSVGLSVIIGAIGSILACLTVPLLDKFKIDDVVGAIPVHLVAGIFGTLIVPLSNSDASYGVQAIGVGATAVFVCAISAVVWFLLKVTIGLRPSEEDEIVGLDQAEIGVPAYPEFVPG